MTEFRRSEIAAEAWRQRYVRGVCEIEEMEAGIARALAGECSDAEWVQLSRERRDAARDPSLQALDSALKALYLPPIRIEAAPKT